jgi:uncharacterized pyridoxamine 5'-phosphate oxidase family protein
MKEIYEFLKECVIYYLATVDGELPKVRPFATINIFENKLYFQTGKSKQVSKQLAVNPKISICTTRGDEWVRMEATAIEDDRVVAKKSMLDSYPELRSRYDENDDNTQVWYLKDVTATIESFSAKKKIFHF